MEAVLLALALSSATQTKPAIPEKVDIVAVGGCLREASPDTWTLVNASEPVVSTSANAPSPKELAAVPKSGSHVYRLLGVTVFNLPSHRGHNVVVKGLYIKAKPDSRLNVTSVTMVSAECPPK